MKKAAFALYHIYMCKRWWGRRWDFMFVGPAVRMYETEDLLPHTFLAFATRAAKGPPVQLHGRYLTFNNFENPKQILRIILRRFHDEIVPAIRFGQVGHPLKGELDAVKRKYIWLEHPDHNADSFKFCFLLVVKRNDLTEKLAKVLDMIRNLGVYPNKTERKTSESQLALREIFDRGLADGFLHLLFCVKCSSDRVKLTLSEDAPESLWEEHELTDYQNHLAAGFDQDDLSPPKAQVYVFRLSLSHVHYFTWKALNRLLHNVTA